MPGTRINLGGDMKGLDRIFHLSENGTTVKKEFRGALTSFFSIVYIVFVTPSYLAETGMNYTSVLIAACISAALGCLLSAFFNVPVMLTPGVGLNAFFTYTLCFAMGYSWQQALAIVSISGVLYLIITLTPLRDMLISCMPPSMKSAITAGLGIFIALIGLIGSGIVKAENGMLLLGDIGVSSTILAIIGLFISGVLLAWKINGALLIGIIATTLIGFPLGVSKMPESMSLNLSSVKDLFLALDYKGVFSLGILPLITALITFTLCICFNTLGGLFCIAGAESGSTKDDALGRYSKGMIASAIGNAVVPLIGGPPLLPPVEGATGVSDGARTGLYSLFCGVLFLLTTLISPLASIIPGAATSPALILIGMMMIGNATNIYWHNVKLALPCFITMIMIPFTYSVADGIGVGLISYTAIQLVTGNAKKVPPITWVLSASFVIMYVLSAF